VNDLTAISAAVAVVVGTAQLVLDWMRGRPKRRSKDGA
jgi:hypothetical protein